MRIALIGQAPFGAAVFKRLVEQGEQIVGISAPGTPLGGSPDPLRVAADERGMPVFTTRDLKKPDVYAAYLALEPDLNVMAYVTDILTEKVIFTPKLDTIQYHPSLLPQHRGASAMNWAIIQGDKRTGLTLFWPDKGIDTGPILLQKEVVIGSDDTLGSLYFGKLFPMGVEAVAEAVAAVKDGAAPKIAQDDAQATYEPICTDEHAGIDWSKPARDVYNLIRGCNPQPGAHTTFRGERLKVFDCCLQDEVAKDRPGTVSAVNADGIVVALERGALAVQRLQLMGSSKLKAPDFVAASGLTVGEQLGMIVDR